MPAFSVNDGYIIRKHPSGAWIYMKVDDPGTFIDASGERVPVQWAKEAGFDVSTLEKEARKKVALREAQRRIDREYAEQSSDLERVMTALTETGDVSVRKITGGKYALFDAKAKRLTGTGLTKAEADMLYTAATGNSEPKLDEPTLEG